VVQASTANIPQNNSNTELDGSTTFDFCLAGHFSRSFFRLVHFPRSKLLVGNWAVSVHWWAICRHCCWGIASKIWRLEWAGNCLFGGWMKKIWKSVCFIVVWSIYPSLVSHFWHVYLFAARLHRVQVWLLIGGVLFGCIIHLSGDFIV